MLRPWTRHLLPLLLSIQDLRLLEQHVHYNVPLTKILYNPVLQSLPRRAKTSLGLKALLCLMWPENDSGHEFSPTCSIGSVLLAQSYSEKNNILTTKKRVYKPQRNWKDFSLLFCRIGFGMCFLQRWENLRIRGNFAPVLLVAGWSQPVSCSLASWKGGGQGIPRTWLRDGPLHSLFSQPPPFFVCYRFGFLAASAVYGSPWARDQT